MTEARAERFEDQPAVVFRMVAHMKITALGQRQDVEVVQSRLYLRSGPLRKVTSRFKTDASDVEVVGVVRGDKLMVTSRMGALENKKEFPAEAEGVEAPGRLDDRRFVGIPDADENRARERKLGPRTQLGLGKRHPEGRVHPHHLAGGLHLRAENHIHARETVERHHRGLDLSLIHI